MRTDFVRAICALTLCLIANAAAAQAQAAKKAHAPSWKYHAYHVHIDVARDGSSTAKYEFAYTVLAEAALQSLNEQDISYHEHDGALEDVVAYTLKKDGTRLDVPESNIQLTSRNGINGTPPAFSDFMSRHLVYPSVEVGDTVVLAYTLKNLKPTFKNYYALLMHFSDAYAYDDAELTITAPTAMGLKHKTYHLDAPKITRLDKERQQWQWSYQNLAPRDTREESSQYERIWRYADLPTIEFSNYRDYRQIAAGYEEEAARRSVVNERIRLLAEKIVAGATNRRERAERIYDWVAKEISFAGNCLTGGDVVPRDTDLILNMKMGDCKDHATLLQALLSAQQIKSTQVLINAQDGYELPEVPCWQAFNHVMNYLPEFNLYVDATSSSSPFGTLPAQDRGKPVIHTASFDGVRHTPSRGADANWSETSDSVTVLADGSLEVAAKYRLGGDLANAFSKRFRDWKASPDFDDGANYLKRAIEGQGYVGGGRYEGIADSGGPEQAFSYEMKYDVHEFVDTSDPHGMNLTAFFPSPNPISELVAYAAVDHFDHDFACHGDKRSEELTIHFPDNIHLLAIPKDVHAKTALVQFDAIYSRDANTIHVKRTVNDQTPGPVCAPEIVAQYARIAAAVKKDLNAQVVYEPK